MAWLLQTAVLTINGEMKRVAALLDGYVYSEEQAALRTNRDETVTQVRALCATTETLAKEADEDGALGTDALILAWQHRAERINSEAVALMVKVVGVMTQSNKVAGAVSKS